MGHLSLLRRTRRSNSRPVLPQQVCCVSLFDVRPTHMHISANMCTHIFWYKHNTIGASSQCAVAMHSWTATAACSTWPSSLQQTPRLTYLTPHDLPNIKSNRCLPRELNSLKANKVSPRRISGNFSARAASAACMHHAPCCDRVMTPCPSTSF